MKDQRKLSANAIQAFYHNDFVVDQTRDFLELSRTDPEGGVVDVGGGCGFFARSIQECSGRLVRVIDMDPRSVEVCREHGTEAELGDALNPRHKGDEAVVCFNLILHHLVAQSEGRTRALQQKALGVWHGQAKAVFVNEYIYESFVSTASGWLIYRITKSRALSTICKLISRVIPSFRANTFGVGVRFRAHQEWRELFAESGYEVAGCRIGKPEHISPPLRCLLIREIRRDSFWLIPGSSRLPLVSE